MGDPYPADPAPHPQRREPRPPDGFAPAVTAYLPAAWWALRRLVRRRQDAG